MNSNWLTRINEEHERKLASVFTGKNKFEHHSVLFAVKRTAGFSRIQAVGTAEQGFIFRETPQTEIWDFFFATIDSFYFKRFVE